MKSVQLRRKLLKRSIPVIGLFFISIFIFSCATYQNKVSDARVALQQGDYEKAIGQLKLLAEKENGDQLVYLLDYATAQQMAGRYKESTDLFLKADKLSEMQDYHSISRITGAALLSEEMVQYKGDTFEKTFINAYLALNFIQMGMLDEALVEARRINEKYLKLRGEEKKSYELNPFAKYLSALLWEADKKWDDAYIAYNETYKIDPSIPALREDLLRSAKLARREDEYKKWKKEFPDIVEDPLWSNRKSGELVVIYLQGWGPRKQPSYNDAKFPMLVPIPSETTSVRMNVEPADAKKTEAPRISKLVYNVTNAAIQTLNDDFGALVARRVGAFAAKEVAADQIRQKDELLGAIAWVAMHASDRADLRQWSTLPSTIQIIRKPLLAGNYDVSLQGLSDSGAETSDRLPKHSIEIKSGQKKFVIYRSLK